MRHTWQALVQGSVTVARFHRAQQPLGSEPHVEHAWGAHRAWGWRTRRAAHKCSLQSRPTTARARGMPPQPLRPEQLYRTIAGRPPIFGSRAQPGSCKNVSGALSHCPERGGYPLASLGAKLSDSPRRRGPCHQDPEAIGRPVTGTPRQSKGPCRRRGPSGRPWTGR